MTTTSEMKGALRLAVHDAATNCARDGGMAFVTLRSGAMFAGRLEKPTPPVGFDTVHMKTPTGWATIDADEVVAIETKKL